MLKVTYRLIAIAICVLFWTTIFVIYSYAGDGNPPKRYDHVPTVPYEIIQVRAPDVWKKCNQLTKKYTKLRLLSQAEGPDTLACAIPIFAGAPKCFIVVYNQKFIKNSDWLRGYTQKQSIRHEFGHCNGWGPNHEM